MLRLVKNDYDKFKEKSETLREENKEKFLTLVDNLIQLGAELLEKLFELIEEVVRTLIFKYKLATN